MRRVVVTGLGLVTPLGADVETSWKNLIAGRSGAAQITHFDASNQKCTIACEVKDKDHEFGFDPDKRVDPKVQRQVDPFIVYGIDAAGQAFEDAGLEGMDQATKERTGVSIGAGIGGLPGIELESVNLHERGPSRVSPHFVHGRLINLVGGQVSIKYGLMGPNHAVVTACSTGAHSIGDAARMIKDDDADIMLAGGAESTVNPLGVAGFAQARALNTSMNDEPEKASRPYDKGRNGFVMGEGAGVVVLEEYEHAKARGAKIYAEVVGIWPVGRCLSCDRAASRRTRGGAGDEDGDEEGGHGALRHRLCQCAWDQHHGRHDRAGRGQARAGRRSVRRQHVEHQVRDRAFARWGGGGRGDLLHSRHPRPDRAAHAQSRTIPTRGPRVSTWSPTPPKSAKSTPCSATASASAAPMPA